MFQWTMSNISYYCFRLKFDLAKNANQMWGRFGEVQTWFEVKNWAGSAVLSI